MGVMTFGHQPALRVARPSTRTEDRVQLGSGRVGVAQLIQPSQREDERLLDRISGIFPAAKEMERVGVERCPGPSIAACAAWTRSASDGCSSAAWFTIT